MAQIKIYGLKSNLEGKKSAISKSPLAFSVETVQEVVSMMGFQVSVHCIIEKTTNRETMSI